MRATGIVRRIDDLGRIVIPKEIRRTLRIGEGCPLEIFTESDGSVIFKKYSPVSEMANLAEIYAQAISAALSRPCCICDTDRIIAVAGTTKKDLIDKPVADNIVNCIGNYNTGTQMKKSSQGFQLTENCDRLAAAVCPIAVSGDPIGAVILIKTDKPEDEYAVQLIKFAAVLLGNL
jgi:AbrB family transcriptional regulator (stage V sporulation protein T)